MKKLTLVPLLTLAATASYAQIWRVDYFVGSLYEGFEGFNNYSQGPYYLPNPTAVMGGAAALTTTQGIVYQPGVADFGLGDRGLATVADGAKGLGVNTLDGVASLTFARPINEFGGYFDYAAVGKGVTFRFFGNDGAQIGSDMLVTVPYGNQMGFAGFASSVGIERVEFSGVYLVADGLRANPVPEPTTVAFLAIGALELLRRRIA